MSQFPLMQAMMNASDENDDVDKMANLRNILTGCNYQDSLALLCNYKQIGP